MKDDLKRPDPDALLQSIKEETPEEGGGPRLKIFLGMAAGVGKTYAMLEEAQRLVREGVDIVIGYVETHGRVETEELVKGLEIVPRKKIDYQNITIEEFDIDAVLARRPTAVLVDELAHTNVEGSRHTKRYQDVRELLDNGINVYSTLNIQHLESQADVVEKITGVKIRETLPDSILDLADEIELIDIPPEELLKRLAEGKVYMPEKAGLAAERFFRKGNITALREMALHYTARLVGYELRDYTQKKNIKGPWKSGERLLVAVSPSPYSEYLVRWTRRIAFNLNIPWIALFIEKQRKLPEQARRQLAKNLDLARELGAEVLTIADENIVSGLLSVARQKNITQIVVGKPLRRYLSDFFSGGTLVERLLKSSGDIEIHVVTQPDVHAKKPGTFSGFQAGVNPRAYFITAAIVAGNTAVNLFLSPFTGYWTVALLYLLGVVLLSLFFSRGPVLLAAGLSALLWDFLFIPPVFTFRIAKLEDAMMFGMYFVIAAVVGSLTSRLRSKERALRIREQRITELYEFSRTLGDALGINEVIGTALKYINDKFNAKSALLLSNDSGQLSAVPHASGTFEISFKERGVAEWSFKNRKPAGLFTDTLPKSEARYTPLIAPGRLVGILGIRPLSVTIFSLEQENFLQNISYQLAMRIERENLSNANQKALLDTESERLYKILLNSITHELRTPLTAIKGLLSTIIDPTVGDDSRTRNELLGETQEATERLIRLVDNLLEMNRIESGKLALNLDWNDISDIINITLNRLEPHIKKHKISVNCPEDIPLIRVDYNLISQALYCIINNALVHTGVMAPVAISVSCEERGVSVTIEDEGPGLPEQDMEKLFDKFYHIGKAQTNGGLGLGLSISKGIVELHGGRITAGNRKEGGARFVIFLPV
jgi:two-component system, OmpR family, sensor histidine kinase KdpD